MSFLNMPKPLTAEEIQAALKLSRKPWQHQVREFVESQHAVERGFRWDMGTGKTLAAVSFLRLKYRLYGKVSPTLILAPLATMGGWKKTFDAESPEAVRNSVAICAGFGKKKLSGAKRAAMIADPANLIVVTNFASLNMPEVLKALQAKGFQYLVVDEIDEFKNPKAKRLENLLSFSDRCVVRLGMTGTLTTGGRVSRDGEQTGTGMFDVWGPCRIIDGGKRFGTNYFSHFRRKYFEDVNAGNPYKNWPEWRIKNGASDDIAQKLASLWSDAKKDECLDLPERVTMREEVELSPAQQKAYSEMEDQLVSLLGDESATASNALVKLLRMRQILSGFIGVDINEEDPTPGRVEMLGDNPRMERLEELLRQLASAGKKVVVWSNFRPNYPQFRELAERLGYGYAELNGDTKDRQAEIERFQADPNCMFFFSNPAAGGVGVDGLQHVASYCVYFDRSHNLRHYLQSRDRIYRGGSEVHDKITEIHLVAPGTLDDDILAALEGKEDFANDLLNKIRSVYAGQRRKVAG